MELKPCPFCGSESVSIMYNHHGDYAVNCDATRGGCGATSGYAQMREAAVAAWNRRADDGKEILSKQGTV